jgi:hypothetical protein
MRLSVGREDIIMLSINGYAIEWTDKDEHIGIEGLLAGRQSSESQQSFERWLIPRTTPGKS